MCIGAVYTLDAKASPMDTVSTKLPVPMER